MTLRDTLFTNPHWVILGLLVWVPVAAMAFMLIGAMIMGDIDPISGIFGLFAALALGVLGIKPPDPSLTPWIFAAAMMTWILLPVVRVAMNRREHAKMRMEAVESAYEALYRMPLNLGARLKLAKALFDQGMVGSAVAIGEASLQGVSKRDYADDLRMVKHWKYRLGTAVPQPVRCAACGRPNPPEECFCQHCGKPYLLDYARGWVKGLGVGRVLVVWAACVALIAGIPVLAASAPAPVTLVAIPALILFAGVLLWRTFLRGFAT